MAKKKTSKKNKEYYVDPEEFYLEMCIYKKDFYEAKESDAPKPKVPDHIALKFIKISHKLSFSKNFINYPFREDMVGDGIEDCIKYIHNFNEIDYKNPFSYFTQICYWAFLRKIKKEKHQYNTRARVVQNLDLLQQANQVQDHDVDAKYLDDYRDFLRDFYDVNLEEYETKMKIKVKK